jgi:hypothetical protein
MSSLRIPAEPATSPLQPYSIHENLHTIRDELEEFTTAFHEMSDDQKYLLVKEQYLSLEKANSSIIEV